MQEFIMAHELITLFIVLSIIWAIESCVVAIVNRNKPSCNCEFCCDAEDPCDDEDDE